MANYYTQFSEAIPNLTTEEETWLRRQLEYVFVFGEQEYAEGELPASLDLANADWEGIRASRNAEDADRYTSGCQHEFHDATEWDDYGRTLWLYSDEQGDPEFAAHLAHQFLKRFRPDQCWSLTYARTCSRLRFGAFTGGAVFVTADDIRWYTARRFVEDEQKHFCKRHQKRRR